MTKPTVEELLAQALLAKAEADEKISRLEAQVGALQRELTALRAVTPRNQDDYP